MTVKALLQSFLVKVVTNEANSTSKNKQSIKYANVQVLLSLFSSETSTASQQINNTCCYNAINVKNEVWFLRQLNEIMFVKKIIPKHCF